MTVPQNAETIRVKVIGLARRDKRLLAFEVDDGNGRLKGVRPLGGAVDFGKTREQALHREFLEELGTRIEISGPWHVFDSIYEDGGRLWHEIVFAAEVILADLSLYARDEIVFSESDGTICRAKWFGLEELEDAGLALYPDGLGERLLARPGA